MCKDMSLNPGMLISSSADFAFLVLDIISAKYSFPIIAKRSQLPVVKSLRLSSSQCSIWVLSRQYSAVATSAFWVIKRAAFPESPGQVELQKTRCIKVELTMSDCGSFSKPANSTSINFKRLSSLLNSDWSNFSANSSKVCTVSSLNARPKGRWSNDAYKSRIISKAKAELSSLS